MKKYSIQELTNLLIELKPVLDSGRNNLVINCPYCGLRECSISIKDHHKWGCYRKMKCGETGNLFKILIKLGKFNQLIKEENIDNSFDTINIKNLSLNFRSKNETIDNTEQEEIESTELELINMPLGWTRTFNDEYLNKRNFTNYDNYPVGRTNMDPEVRNDYVIFSIENENKNAGWIGRNVLDKNIIESINKKHFEKTGFKNKIKRYKNSRGTNFSRLLYGLDEIKTPKTACLVEGIFDKHAVDKKLNLINDKFMYCLSTFKCFVSDYQILQLKKRDIDNLILFYDPDVIKEIQKNVIKLEKYFNLKIIISSKDKDPDELSESEIIDCFEKNMYSVDQIKIDFLQQKYLKF